MNILYFCPGKTLGHLLEYFHHFFEIASKDVNNSYYCLMGDNYDDVQRLLDWPAAPNIKISIVSDSSPFDQQNIILKSIAWCRLMRQSVKKHKIQRVFLPCLAEPMPLLPFILCGLNVKVAGILYNISYYYTKRGFLRKTRDHIINLLYAHTRKITNVFLLNADKAVVAYNAQFKTTKFMFLPDPYAEQTYEEAVDIRAKYNIPKTDTVFCLFGMMSAGKNIENILKAFSELPTTIKSQCWLITAGDVRCEYQSHFDQLCRHYQPNMHWITEKQFMPNNFINGLVNDSNFIFMTYPLTGRSSGMFGYSSRFSTPVIASRGGMVEEIVNKYKLGFCLDSISANSIKNFIIRNYDKRIAVPKHYIEDHNLQTFKELIYHSIC